MIGLIRAMVRRDWSSRLLSPLFGCYHPFHPDYRKDPYATYERLRKVAPIYRHPLLRIWLLSRYSEIEQVLKDPRFSVVRSHTKRSKAFDISGQMSPRLVGAVRSLLLMLDPPDHTRMRKLVNKAFSTSRVDALRAHIQEVVDETLSQLAYNEEIELMRDFAIPIPLRLITELLGVPSNDLALFKGWSTRLTTLLDPINGEASLEEAGEAFDELDEYFRNLFESRRLKPRGDLVSALVAVKEGGDRLSELELLSLVFLILVAGHETTTNLIGNAVVAMMRNPDQLRYLQYNPSLIETAVEEFLRFDSPVQATQRVLIEDAEIGGTRMRKGELVLCLIGSANRDPKVFEEPDKLNISREVNQHLAFGQGIHFCLGAQLARLEAQVALGTLLAVSPRLAVDEENINWKASIYLRGPRSLPLFLQTTRNRIRN